MQPAEYRADLVVLLLDGEPVLGTIVRLSFRVTIANGLSGRYMQRTFARGCSAQRAHSSSLLMMQLRDG